MSVLPKGNRTASNRKLVPPAMGTRSPLKNDGGSVDGYLYQPGLVDLGDLDATTATFRYPIGDGETLQIKDILIIPYGTITINDTNYFSFDVGYRSDTNAYVEAATAKLSATVIPEIDTEFSFKDNSFFVDYDSTKLSGGTITGPTVLVVTCTETATAVLQAKVCAVLQHEWME